MPTRLWLWQWLTGGRAASLVLSHGQRRLLRRGQPREGHGVSDRGEGSHGGSSWRVGRNARAQGGGGGQERVRHSSTSSLLKFQALRVDSQRIAHSMEVQGAHEHVRLISSNSQVLQHRLPFRKHGASLSQHQGSGLTVVNAPPS